MENPRVLLLLLGLHRMRPAHAMDPIYRIETYAASLVPTCAFWDINADGLRSFRPALRKVCAPVDRRLGPRPEIRKLPVVSRCGVLI